MTSLPTRLIAVDWSGAVSGAAEKIWIAEAIPDGGLLLLENGRGRESVTQWLIAEARRTPSMIVGLDFAFSAPSWFLEQRGLGRAHDLWTLANCEGERWLQTCEPPFWGRRGKRRPDLPDHFRRTDQDVPAIAGIRPKSVFQIGGAGAVGTGSWRGMRCLHQLQQAGLGIWPFDFVPDRPTIIEIYPRLLTGSVVKTNAKSRAQYLDEHFPQLAASMRELAASSEDAFDAAVSALVMAVHASELAALPIARDRLDLLEGRIWCPGGS